MRAWRALLWKEGREELPKVLVGLGLCAVVVALRQNAEFNEEFAWDFARWITNFISVCGVALGMGLVAKESSRGTLSFLLGKPLSVVGVLLPKYVVGAVALLVLAAGAWMTVYVDLEGLASRDYSFYGSSGYWHFSLKQFAEEVGYVNMLLVHLTTGLVAYSLIFASSTVADHPLKGAALGILLVVAVVLLRRYREAMLSWRTVAIGWGAVIVVVFAIFYGGPLVNQRMPVGVLAAPDEQHYGDLAVQGGLA